MKTKIKRDNKINNNIGIIKNNKNSKSRLVNNRKNDVKTRYKDKIRGKIFVSEVIEGNIVNRDRFNKISLNRKDQKEWKLKRSANERKKREDLSSKLSTREKFS